MSKKSMKNVSLALISQQDKEHLKSLFAEFLSHREYRELESGWLRESEMMITLCAAYGKFDFSVVLEHFSDIMSVLKFIGNPKEFMTWNSFVIHYAAYWLLNCPLLKLTTGSPNDFKFMEEQLNHLLFVSYSCPHKNGKPALPETSLPGAVQKIVDNEDVPALLKKIDDEPKKEKIIADIIYASLLKEKWGVFAGICGKYDPAQYVDMEKVFTFWSNDLISCWLHESRNPNKTFDFPGQWNEPEKYPLHRMMIEYGRERSVPALYNQGFLLPEVIEYLWDHGISFDTPLTQLYGWEKVNFPEFASCFGGLTEKIKLLPMPKYCSLGEKIFRQNVKSADFFNAYSAGHPRQVSVTKAVPVKTKKGELTPEQKTRLANDEAIGVEFSENKRILKCYASCIDEPDEWINDGYAVPDFVTAIGAEAFAKMEGIQVKTIILPEGLTKIGPRAFEGVEIEKVIFPSSLKMIGKEAFVYTCLKEIFIPEGISKIEEDAFSCCTSLKSLILPDSLTELGNMVFRNCSSLTEVHLPANLKIIPAGAFSGCTKLESIVIPDGVQEIAVDAFGNCTKLRSVEVPEGIKIHEAAFEDHSPELKITYRKPKKS